MLDQSENAWRTGMAVARRLEHAGYSAYFVGGCVRDKLLGRKVNDIDIATSARPEQTMELFPGALPTGLKHGTVTVREEGLFFEVTTFRQETGYSDSRHPDEVAFVLDVREDLARRDFTFNAMAIGADGALVDPFGGEGDLRSGTIRAVGAASERFGEDALRMLRGIRFAAQLGFAFDQGTWEGLILMRSKLRYVAMERVGAELDKLANSRYPERAIAMLTESGLLEHAKEHLPASVLEGWKSDYLRRSLSAAPADPDLRWAALLLPTDAGQAETAEWMRTLRFSVRRSDRVAAIVGLQRFLSATLYEVPAVKESLRHAWVVAVLAYGRSVAEDWLRLASFMPSAAAEIDPLLLRFAAEWLRELPVASVAELAVRGDELVSQADDPPGPWIAVHLRKLLEQSALGLIPNEKNALLKAFERNRQEER